MTTATRKRISAEGRKAYRDGKAGICPYGSGTPAERHWRKGYDGACRDDIHGRKKAPESPACPYCGAEAVLHERSTHLYGETRNHGPVWQCEPCKAWVHCHPKSTRPLGTLADADTRRARNRAHAAFDPLWKYETYPEYERANAYAWLRQQLGIPEAECHIAMMDVPQCERVVTLCRNRRKAA